MAEQVKQAARKFLHRDGEKTTTVHEKIAPAVVHEQVKPVQQETVSKVVDKEVHQDHYHTSVQPIKDRQVLPEQHTHSVAATQEQVFDHSGSRNVQDRRAAEAAQFKDQRVVADTQHTQSVAPTTTGEHVHHHVHETVQPVVERETIQPSVVHITVPIHEIHHNAAVHHAAGALPAITMEEFKRQGGALRGRAQRTDAFAGEPKGVAGNPNGSTLQNAAK